jgi:hypothetical protein
VWYQPQGLAGAKMSDIPKFTPYGEGDSATEQSIQPTLALRGWNALSKAEKKTALQQLQNLGWLRPSNDFLQTIQSLNQDFLRVCPGKHLHNLVPQLHTYSPQADQIRSQQQEAALKDFREIFVNEPNEGLVLRMLSLLAQYQISQATLTSARAKEGKEREALIQKAFENFDRFANCLNHIFEQFSVNQLVTRNSFVPRQDEKITEQLYKPTLIILADPKWTTVNADLSEMFVDYREQRYAEVITKAHSAVQRFLRIVVGDEGNSGKGELAKLVREAKDRGIIPANRFVEPVIAAILSYLPSERATNSTAKPALKDTTPSEALLMMNVVMILLQFCLQNTK